MPSNPKPLRGFARVESPPLVPDLDRDMPVLFDDSNAGAVGASVLGGVAQRFLDEPVDGAFNLRLEAAGLPACLDVQVDIGHHPHAVRLKSPLEEAPQGWLQPDVVECRRS